MGGCALQVRRPVETAIDLLTVGGQMPINHVLSLNVSKSPRNPRPAWPLVQVLSAAPAKKKGPENLRALFLLEARNFAMAIFTAVQAGCRRADPETCFAKL